MQNYYIVRQPQLFPGGVFGPSQGGQFFPPGQGPGFFPPGQGPGFFPPGQGPGFFPPGQGPGFFPPGQGPATPPGQGPVTPPGQGPGGGPGTGPPPGRPPSFVPQQTVGVFAVDPGSIRRCMFRYVYIWLDNRQQFWAWLVFVGRRSIAGWRWTGFRWVYFGVDLNRISSFVCY